MARTRTGTTEPHGAYANKKQNPGSATKKRHVSDLWSGGGLKVPKRETRSVFHDHSTHPMMNLEKHSHKNLSHKFIAFVYS